jgi:hypothetical protein
VRVLKKVLTLAVVAALVLLQLPARTRADDVAVANFMILYDLDATAVTYCRMIGQLGSPFGGTIAGPTQIVTAGSSTTVTGTGAFAQVAVDDVIIISRPAPTATGIPDVRVVTARASADSITVDSAITLTSGFNFRYLKTQCGTTASDGWIDVSAKALKTFTFSWSQGDADAVDVKIQCKHRGVDAPIEELYPGSAGTACGAGTAVAGYCHFATVGVTANLTIADAWPWEMCRMGVKITTVDASDVAAARERVTGIITTSVAR